MIPKPDEDLWVIAPIPYGAAGAASSVQQQVAHHAMGMLRLRYPAPRGSVQAVTKEAIAKYGPALFETLHNIVEEVEQTCQTATVSLRWSDDGRPILTVIRRRIIDPSMN